MLRRITDFDPQRYDAITRMPFGEAVPYIEQYMERAKSIKKASK